MNEQNIPPADAQDLNGYNYWAWFKYHHLQNLNKSYEAINEEYNKHPLGEGFSQDSINQLLLLLDNFIQFAPWLPDASDEDSDMIEIVESRKKFELNYLNKETNKTSFWDLQEINLDVFKICNYMNAVCEDE